MHARVADRSNVSNDDSTSEDASPPMQESSVLSTASLNTTTSPEVLRSLEDEARALRRERKLLNDNNESLERSLEETKKKLQMKSALVEQFIARVKVLTPS